MAEVTLTKLNKYFDTTHVVKDVDLQIRDKEFMVFVGPSGCGKTTTLRMIAGLEAISSGDIRIDNNVVNEVPPMDRDIAMVFQNYALYPHMSVASNMAFGLKMRKFPKDQIQERIKRAAAILGIENLLQRKPRQLSGGQRQRVALRSGDRARSQGVPVRRAARRTSTPSSALRCGSRLKKLQRAALAVTSVYVTHDQVEAMTLGDRAWSGDEADGVVQQVGEPPPSSTTSPPTASLRASIGSRAAMNFADVTLSDQGGKKWWPRRPSLQDRPARRGSPPAPAPT